MTESDLRQVLAMRAAIERASNSVGRLIIELDAIGVGGAEARDLRQALALKHEAISRRYLDRQRSYAPCPDCAHAMPIGGVCPKCSDPTVGSDENQQTQRG